MRKGAKECFEVLAEGQEKNIKSENLVPEKTGQRGAEKTDLESINQEIHPLLAAYLHSLQTLLGIINHFHAPTMTRSPVKGEAKALEAWAEPNPQTGWPLSAPRPAPGHQCPNRSSLSPCVAADPINYFLGRLLVFLIN